MESPPFVSGIGGKGGHHHDEGHTRGHTRDTVPIINTTSLSSSSSSSHRAMNNVNHSIQSNNNNNTNKNNDDDDNDTTNLKLDEAWVPVIDDIGAVCTAVWNNRLLQLMIPFQLSFGMAIVFMGNYVTGTLVDDYIGDGYIGLSLV